MAARKNEKRKIKIGGYILGQTFKRRMSQVLSLIDFHSLSFLCEPLFPCSCSSRSRCSSSIISVKMEMMDTFFFQHALNRHAEEETPSWEFFKTWKERVEACKPKAILIVSAHWVTSHPTVNVVNHNDTIYDFDDFSPYFYKVRYHLCMY
ncbi:hypothetical protein RJ639_023745 [Escallonia herrerae]|uniref:Extradiol ring-cleavage dioxygenase class III enzyme subunit B domain-containing protein n=1 Tax=Escallonia herrerae TaxID=1293975 RepID=A0AA88UZM9_9ASTE|nr:hypothetical protein RJ639_023745 [Escallonia herrerae]